MNTTFDQIKEAEAKAQQTIEDAHKKADEIIQDAHAQGEEMQADIPESISADIKNLINDADRTIKGYQETMKNQVKKELSALEKISDGKKEKAKTLIIETATQSVSKN